MIEQELYGKAIYISKEIYISQIIDYIAGMFNYKMTNYASFGNELWMYIRNKDIVSTYHSITKTTHSSSKKLKEDTGIDFFIVYGTDKFDILKHVVQHFGGYYQNVENDNEPVFIGETRHIKGYNLCDELMSTLLTAYRIDHTGKNHRIIQLFQKMKNHLDQQNNASDTLKNIELFLENIQDWY